MDLEKKRLHIIYYVQKKITYNNIGDTPLVRQL